jgi:hypothetical protein
VRQPRRLAAHAAIVSVFVAGALGAPATVASATNASGGSGCPGRALGAIQTAYADVFSRNTQLPADQRAASLDRGDDPAVRALLDQWLASPISASSTVSALSARCPSRNRAVVDGVLVLAGVSLPEVLPPGRAVRRAGTWKVALSTFCTRMVLEDPSLADAGLCAG